MSETESGIVPPPDPAHLQRAGDPPSLASNTASFGEAGPPTLASHTASVGEASWDDLRHTLRHRAKEAIDLISILIQDAVILLAGYLTEVAYEKWLHSEHPFFKLAISLSSSLFLLLYVITVTVHVVNYVRGSFGMSSATRLGRAMPWAVAAVAVIGAVVVAALPSVGGGERGSGQEAHDLSEPIRFQIVPPVSTPAWMLTLSADGRYLAFIASAGGPNQVWVRDMQTLEPHALPGTDGATYPFWSPDARHIGFFAQGKLKKVAVAGGPPQTLCDAADGRGGTWNAQGTIVFSAAPASPLQRVSAAGGALTAVTTLGSATGHRFPSFLPDGEHLVYSAIANKPDDGGLYIANVNGDPPQHLLSGRSKALYASPSVPGGPGYLLFGRDDALMAQPFDATRLTLSGEVFPIADRLAQGQNIGFGEFSVSATGALAFRSGGGEASRRLVWIDRAGKSLGMVGKPGAFIGSFNVRLSPDDSTAAVAVVGAANQFDIWLQDLKHDVSTRFTFRPSNYASAVWSPDGTRLLFALQPPVSSGVMDLYVKPASGNGQDMLLAHAGLNAAPSDWSPDGKWLLFSQTAPKTGNDLWLLPLDGDRTSTSAGRPEPVEGPTARPYLQTPANERFAAFSPDGRWVAYASDESVQYQIYIQAFPATGAKFQISVNGGTWPVWRRDGKELFYVSPDQKLMAVPITLGASVVAGIPQALFSVAGSNGYSATRDGQRFLVNLPASAEGVAAPPVTMVLNWQAGLKTATTGH